jgi:hypothetical protein
MATGLVVAANCGVSIGHRNLDPALHGHLQIQEKAEGKGTFIIYVRLTVKQRQKLYFWSYTVKSFLIFPYPALDVTYQTLYGRE